MRIVNVMIFIALFVLLFIWMWKLEWKNTYKWLQIIYSNIYVVIILFIANALSFAMTFQGADKQIILTRDGVSGKEKQIPLILKRDEEKYPVSLTIRRQQLSGEELKKRMKDAFSDFEKQMCGENKTREHITKNLNFNMDYDKYPFDITIVPDQYLLMDEDGVIRNDEEDLKNAGYEEKIALKGIETGFLASMSYGEIEESRHYDICIFPKEKTENENAFVNVRKQLERWESESIYDCEIQIPTMVNGISISEEKNLINNPLFLLVAGVVLSGLFALRKYEMEKSKEKHREELLRKSYPWFVNEMVLLLGAGMQVKHIFGVLIQEYEIDKKRTGDEREPLVKELQIAKQNMEMGISEQQTYYQLGRRLKLSGYIKLMTLLEQNVKKGTKGLTAYFEQEEKNALEERKNIAKKCGEEAGTKLLGPMILQLFIVMLIIMIPAFMSF